MKATTIPEFYAELHQHLPQEVSREIGHFNVFNYEEVYKGCKNQQMPYNRRTYYKISLLLEHNEAQYADKTIEIDNPSLLFATPHIPYNWISKCDQQRGFFCVFTEDFMAPAKIGIRLEDFTLFQPGNVPIFRLEPDHIDYLTNLFQKINTELSGDYAFKYDLIRNYVMELIHFGQKLQPATALYPKHNATSRITSLFIELLERQFPIENKQQRPNLRTASHFADQLAVHVNHLNKVLKETTGLTTSNLVSKRFLQEAKILLKQTDWSVSEISDSLGFEEIAHFSNFFRKQEGLSPLAFRDI
ncbi:helix-turn-helix domain-containing protein [Flavobacterium silvaticum]|uniref:Helix-turn-helix transcriptional regulator n=1 Tax=Flavobacterium silvaticum TaxID=1852020 RepID=A0A972FZA2_9FLAO|nr:AraC family transcriptional regulator [Flavobacterium silvaticum]NMH27546.1 helix-turn-helix transcriptional regulator [Flavobacterium silvaticum]